MSSYIYRADLVSYTNQASRQTLCKMKLISSEELMNYRLNILNIVRAAFCLVCCLSAVSNAGAKDSQQQEQGHHYAVEIEEIVTRYTPANNGAGPMWCYGSTVIARQNSDVYLSTIETGKDVPLLCNTRWQLWHRTSDGWKLKQTEKAYRQREPCPIAIFQDGPVFLSVNRNLFCSVRKNPGAMALTRMSFE